jgi:hypothetical protein
MQIELHGLGMLSSIRLSNVDYQSFEHSMADVDPARRILSTPFPFPSIFPLQLCPVAEQMATIGF